jgi:enediyne biosynthesis protein E4
MQISKYGGLIALLLSGSGLLAQSGFVDATVAAGVAHHGFNALQMGGGSAWFDYDGDGDEDLIAVGGLGDNKLFRNEGNGAFTDVTMAAGLGGIHFDTQGVVTGDVDNDGFREIFISTLWHQPNLFFHNNGDGTFTDVSVASGIGLDSMWVSSAAFGDFDRDGLLDLYRGNYVWRGEALVDSTGQPIGYKHRCNPNSLFHNNGNGTFTDVAAQYGVADTGCALAVVFSDYDQDHDIDIMVANDFGAWVKPNALYQNQYPLPFADVSAATHTDQAMYGMGIAVGDYDHDLDLDYYVTDIGAAAFFQQQLDHTFIDVADQAGVLNDSVGGALGTGWGDAWLDYDNDTWQDLFIAHGFIQLIPIFINQKHDPDIMYRNLGNGTFQDVSLSLSLGDTNMGRGMAMADYDRDGDLDLFVNVVNNDSTPWENSRLYRNAYAGPNHWLQVQAQGTYSNRDAFGALMIIRTGNEKWVHEVNGGSSHMSQHTSIAHFGTAADTLIDSLWVIWPSGGVQLLTDIPADQRIVVVEDSASFLQLAAPEIGYFTAYPNPFSQALTVKYMVVRQAQAEAQVCDMTGRVVWREQLHVVPGAHETWTWSGQSQAGGRAAAGLYSVRIVAGGQSEMLRVVRF